MKVDGKLAIFVGTLLSVATLSACNQEEAVSAGSAKSQSESRSTTESPTKSPCHSVVSLSPEAQKLSHLQYAEVHHKLLDLYVKTTGEVLANANLMTHVTTPVTGRVTEVLVKVGDHCTQGQPLIRIRSTDIEQAEADLLQNEAQVRADLQRDLLQVDCDLATAQAQIKLSESTFNRLKNLVEEKIASRAEYEAAKTGFEKDKITLDTLQRKRTATISLSRERMTLLTEPTKLKLRLLGVTDQEIEHVLKTHDVDPIVPVLAPENGIISERLVNVGELVDPTKPLFTIGDYDSVWLTADIYEKDVSKVKEGQPIDLDLESFPGEKFHGTLNYVADSLAPDTRTLMVRAEVPNPGWKLKPKMFARMRIFVGEHNVLTIPKTAIQDAGSDKVVYVPMGKNFEERKVKLGSESGDAIEVLSGVREGEKVVTRGSFDLRSESMRQST